MKSFTRLMFPANLGDTIEALKERSLPETTRRDLISAINRAATMLDRRPDDITTNVPQLRGQLALIHPAKFGITPKTWANVKSNIKRALVLTNMILDMKAYPPSDAWQGLLATAPQRHHVFGLNRLARFCSKETIAPSELSDDVVQRFSDHLEFQMIEKPPRDVLKATVDTWNLVVRQGAHDLPLLTPIRAHAYRARKLTVYPTTLQQEIEEYLDRLRVVDLFAEEGPTKALKPTSIRNVEDHLRQYLDALVTAGYIPTDLQCLADIVQPGMARSACSVIVDRHKDGKPTSLPNIMATIVAVARFYVKMPDDKLDELVRIRSQVKAHLGVGEVTMGKKSVERLLQFDDPLSIAALLSLPERLMARAKADPDRRYAGLEAMHAVAISILLACPVRAKNLSSIDIERSLSSRIEGKKRLYMLRIMGEDVKNVVPIEIAFSTETSALIATYLREFRHKVSFNPGTALFPKYGGGAARKPSNLGSELKDRINRETGLVVNAHLFRHIGAKLFLDQRPGEYEIVRRLLGHKKLETTVKFYAQLKSKAVFKRYEEEVLNRLSPRDKGGRNG